MIYPINYLGAIMRAIAFFERDLTHNNVSPAYRATLLIKFLEINDLSKVLFDGDIQG
jgi:hypothetical protein